MRKAARARPAAPPWTRGESTGRHGAKHRVSVPITLRSGRKANKPAAARNIGNDGNAVPPVPATIIQSPAAASSETAKEKARANDIGETLEQVKPRSDEDSQKPPKNHLQRRVSLDFLDGVEVNPEFFGGRFPKGVKRLG